MYNSRNCNIRKSGCCELRSVCQKCLVMRYHGLTLYMTGEQLAKYFMPMLSLDQYFYCGTQQLRKKNGFIRVNRREFHHDGLCDLHNSKFRNDFYGDYLIFSLESNREKTNMIKKMCSWIRGRGYDSCLFQPHLLWNRILLDFHIIVSYHKENTGGCVEQNGRHFADDIQVHFFSWTKTFSLCFRFNWSVFSKV